MAPLGLGVDCTAQVVPSQRSASVSYTPGLVWYHPTPVHAEAEVHDTPLR